MSVSAVKLNTHYNLADGIISYVSTQKGASKVISAAKLSLEWTNQFYNHEKLTRLINTTKIADKITSIPRVISHIMCFISAIVKRNLEAAALSFYSGFKEIFSIYKLGGEFNLYQIMKWTRWLGGFFAIGTLLFSLKDLSDASGEIFFTTDKINDKSTKDFEKFVLTQKRTIAYLKIYEAILWIVDAAIALIAIYSGAAMIPAAFFLSIYTITLITSVTCHFLEESRAKMPEELASAS